MIETSSHMVTYGHTVQLSSKFLPSRTVVHVTRAIRGAVRSAGGLKVMNIADHCCEFMFSSYLLRSSDLESLKNKPFRGTPLQWKRSSDIGFVVAAFSTQWALTRIDCLLLRMFADRLDRFRWALRDWNNRLLEDYLVRLWLGAHRTDQMRHVGWWQAGDLNCSLIYTHLIHLYSSHFVQYSFGKTSGI